MNSKAIAAIVAVIVIVVAVGAAVAMSGSNNENVTGNTYYGNGGTFDNGKTSTQLTNSTAPTNFFTYSGHTFTGWNTAADGSGTSYAVGAALPSTTGMSLYAQWSAGSHTITGLNVVSYTELTYTMNGTALSDTVTVNDGANTMTISCTQTMTYDSSAGTLTYENTRGNTVTLTVSIGGSANSVSISCSDNVATITFNATGDITMTVVGSIASS
ncbi:MAG: InlB B-repeat-containing protein [Thermoplasmata archaeon]|nr:InlB B-repeat-containing protein [Thermoplasmata archaeon]